MATDLLSLLQRDHRDIEQGLADLTRLAATISQIRTTLDAVRLGLYAHAEAEDIVIGRALTRLSPSPSLVTLVQSDHDAHIIQERALIALVSRRPGSQTWRDAAMQLRDLVVRHATHEEEVLLPALRSAAPQAVWDHLAGEFATQRLLQLGMLAPSAPIMSYEQLALL